MSTVTMFDVDQEAIKTAAAERANLAYDRLVVEAARRGELTAAERVELREVLAQTGRKLRPDFGNDPSFEGDVTELQRAALNRRTLEAELQGHGIAEPKGMETLIAGAKARVKAAEDELREAKSDLSKLRHGYTGLVQTECMLTRLRDRFPAFFAGDLEPEVPQAAARPTAKRRMFSGAPA